MNVGVTVAGVPGVTSVSAYSGVYLSVSSAGTAVNESRAKAELRLFVLSPWRNTPDV